MAADPSGRSSAPPASSLRGRDAAALVGEIVSGRYRIERLIGEGGMGAVYQAEHTHMRKRLAVKILHADMSRMPEVVARFEREAMAAAHIEHPNVAAATDFGKLPDGSFFLVLEYVEGRSLRKAIEREAPFDATRTLLVVRQIALALERAHALGIVHRDLKPENVMLVDRPNEPDFVKVLDFGIAKVPTNDLGPRMPHGTDIGVQAVLTQVGMVYGTPEYMPPEQALGQEVDARADLYALGVMAFELLSGVRPYEADSKVALLGMQVTAPIPFLADRAPNVRVPPAVETLVRRLLSKEARDRQQTASELVAEIDRLIAVLGQTHGPTGAPGPMTGAMAAQGPERSISTERVSLPASGPAAVSSGFGRGLAAPHSGGASARSSKSGQMIVVVASVAAIGVLVAMGFAFKAFRHHAREADTQGDIGFGADAAAVASTSRDGGAASVGGATGTLDAKAQKAADDALAAAVAPLRDQEKAAATARNSGQVIDLTRQILQSDPPAVNDDSLLADVRNAALDPKFEESAMGLIVTMGSRGGDVLYDIAYSPWSTRYPHARSRATTLLHTPEMRTHVSPILDVTMLIRDASPVCDAKQYFDRAGKDGDFRTNYVLKSLAKSKNPCVREDDSLAKTIATIDARSPDPNAKK